MTRRAPLRGGPGAGTAILFFCLVLAGPAQAADQRLVLEPAATKVTFTLAATIHTVEGEIPLSQGAIRFDAVTGAASGEIVLDARRAETGNRLRDDNMHATVLGSERFSPIVFRPTRIEVLRRSETTADIVLHGNLAIHGMSRPLLLRAHLERGAGESPRVASPRASRFAMWTGG